MKKQFIALQYAPGPGGGGLHPTDPPPVNGGRDADPNGDPQDTEEGETPAEQPAEKEDNKDDKPKENEDE